MWLSRWQKDLILWLMYLPYVPRDIVFCWWKGLNWSPEWRFWGIPVVSIKGRGSRIVIGKRFTACSDSSHNSLGVFQRVMLKTVGHGAEIVIGDNVGISGCTISAAKSIRIGRNVLLGTGVLMTDYDGHPVDPEERRSADHGGKSAPIVLEDDVFVGARAIILKGVVIGRGSVIGAGAVVAKSIPAYSIAVGNPVRVVGDSRQQRDRTP